MRYSLHFLVCLILSGCTVINPIRKSPFNTFKSNIAFQPFDAIIVPGVPYQDEWSEVMRLRILWAKFLYDKGYTKNIIFSGGAVHTPYIESRVMGLYAQALGIPNSSIYTEEKAEHSTENVYYSYYVARQQGFKNIGLATDPYQTNNLKSYIRKYKLDVKILPILFDTVLVMDKSEPKIDPSVARTDDSSFVPLKKREGFFKRIKGTMGKNINYTEEDKLRRKGKSAVKP